MEAWGAKKASPPRQEAASSATGLLQAKALSETAATRILARQGVDSGTVEATLETPPSGTVARQDKAGSDKAEEQREEALEEQTPLPRSKQAALASRQPLPQEGTPLGDNNKTNKEKG